MTNEVRIIEIFNTGKYNDKYSGVITQADLPGEPRGLGLPRNQKGPPENIKFWERGRGLRIGRINFFPWDPPPLPPSEMIKKSTPTSHK